MIHHIDITIGQKVRLKQDVGGVDSLFYPIFAKAGDIGIVVNIGFNFKHNTDWWGIGVLFQSGQFAFTSTHNVPVYEWLEEI